MPSQVEKLRAHASHLLDAFPHLRERYAMLDPMLFVEDVPKTRGSGKQRRGFMILRHSLFLSCAQDIAKLALEHAFREASLSGRGRGRQGKLPSGFCRGALSTRLLEQRAQADEVDVPLERKERRRIRPLRDVWDQDDGDISSEGSMTTDVFFRRFGADGRPLGPEAPAIAGTEEQSAGRVATANGRFVVVCQSYTDERRSIPGQPVRAGGRHGR